MKFERKMNNPDLVGVTEQNLANLVYSLILLKKWRDEHCLGEPELSDDEIDMLGVIEIRPGITISNLAKFLGITLSTITDKLEKLIGLSYVTQQGEGRKLPIHLTEEGKKVLLKGKFRYLHQVGFKFNLQDGQAISELNKHLVDMNSKLLEMLLEPFSPVY